MVGMRGAGYRRLATTVTVCAVASMASACGSDTRADETPAQTGAAAAPGVSGGTDEHAEMPEPEPYPAWSAGARRAARAAARTVMVRFARPGRRAAAWYDDLAPLLSLTAAAAYHRTDPASVPPSEVTGAVTLAGRSSPYLARVRVPTDAGRYTVLLSRAGEGSPWLAERLTPPKALRRP